MTCKEIDVDLYKKLICDMVQDINNPQLLKHLYSCICKCADK